jgi:hypothetical protein
MSGLSSFLPSCIEFVSLPFRTLSPLLFRTLSPLLFLTLSPLLLLYSPLVLRDTSPSLGGGGGGGIIEARLFVLVSITALWGLSRDDEFLAGNRVGEDTGRDEELAEELWYIEPRIEAGRRDGGGGGTRPLSERGLVSLVVGSMLAVLCIVGGV